MLLIKGARVFAPEDRGVNDVLVIGDRIATVGCDLVLSQEADVVEGTGGYLLPERARAGGSPAGRPAGGMGALLDLGVESPLDTELLAAV
jgi:hypothetical protein